MTAREITLNLDDPDLRARLRRVLSHTDPGSLVISELVDRIIREFAASEPSEPPPGVYRDSEGTVWHHDGVGRHCWRAAGYEGSCEWPEVAKFAPLLPLFTVEELIPDPDDPAARYELCSEAAVGLDVRAQVLTDVTKEVCRVLRNRAVSRG